MCLVTYVVMAVILRKLDQLDVSRVRAIPFCGKGGRFKYEILVKTGWGRGSGEGPLSLTVIVDNTAQGLIDQMLSDCGQAVAFLRMRAVWAAGAVSLDDRLCTAIWDFPVCAGPGKPA